SPVGYSLSATPSTDLSTLSLHDALPIFPEHVAIARRIQHRARTDDARGWQTGGFPYGIGQQIYWVGRYNKKAIEACLHDRFNDGIHDGDIFIHQVQASFAGLLRSACGNQDDGCILAIFVSAFSYSCARRRPHHAMV